MPARIVVWSGTAVEQEHWIEQPVVRIGSDPAADLVLPGTPLHAFTVQYRAGRYRLFNRTRQNVPLGDQRLAPEQSDVWNPGQPLPLPGGSALYLVIDGDPAPQPRRLLPNELPPDLDDAPPPLPPSAEPRRKLVQYGILAGCLLLGALVLMTSKPARNSTAEFAALKEQHRQFPPEEGADLLELLDPLQSARRAELRQDSKAALESYIDVRTRAADRARRRGLAPTPYETSINDFAARRIALLSRQRG